MEISEKDLQTILNLLADVPFRYAAPIIQILQNTATEQKLLKSEKVGPKTTK